jgi:hypothetical protein
VDAIVGTWKLESFDIESADGKRRAWGEKSRGLLFYSDNGHVSVAINREMKDGGTTDRDVLDGMLFYAGTYWVRDGIVHHAVSVASSPARVGRDMIRFAKRDGDLLTLTTPPEPYGTATLVWRKTN